MSETFVRKICFAKWERVKEANRILADAITGDLRTNNNTLSFWRCRYTRREDVEPILLVFAVESERIEKMDLIVVDEEQISNAGFATRDTPGKTKLEELVDKHVDVVDLDIELLGVMAKTVLDAFGTARAIRFTKVEVTNLLKSAVEKGIIRVDDLKLKKEEMEKFMKKLPSPPPHRET